MYGLLIRRIIRELRAAARLALWVAEFGWRRKPLGLSKDGVPFRTAVAFNLFDGEEILIDSLLSYRPYVHKLIVVYQCKGHYGSDHSNPNLERGLKYLKSIGLVDELIKFSNFDIATDEVQFQRLSTDKMNLAIAKARELGCSHLMWVDNDEFFISRQLRYMIFYQFKFWRPKNQFHPNKLMSIGGAVQHVQYYKSPKFQKKEREGEFIATFIPIDCSNVRFESFRGSSVPISPDRTPNVECLVAFSRIEVQMHHLSMVRYSLKDKSRSQLPSRGLNDPFRISERFEQWEYPQKGLWSGGVEFEVKRVKQRIHIPHFENRTFERISAGEKVAIRW